MGKEAQEIINQYVEENGEFDRCPYCRYYSECPQTWKCYGGEPVEPPCAGRGVEEFLDLEAIVEDILESGDL